MTDRQILGRSSPLTPPMYEFAVFVIESPRPDDAYNYRSEMAALQLVGQLDGIVVGGRHVLDLEHFRQALAQGVLEFLAHVRKPYILCLHIGAHGNAEGIGLSGGEFLAWSELRGLLVPVWKLTAGLLILSMAACEGLSARQTAMTLWGEEDLPFMAMVGSSGKPAWSETAIGYATLYHHLKGGASLPDAVNAMKVASGHHDFAWVNAEYARNAYRQALLEFAAQYRLAHAGETGGQQSPIADPPAGTGTVKP